MSKAILIIDMPKKCVQCRFHYNTYDEDDSYVDKCELLDDTTVDGYTERYCDCPLKPIPDKIEHSIYDYDADTGYTCGWNDCIDEILGE